MLTTLKTDIFNPLQNSQLIIVLLDADLEDRRMVQKAVSTSALPEFGPIEFLAASTPEKAAEEWPDKEVDVIVTELNLPDSPGLRSVEKCRQFWPETPVLVLTHAVDASLGHPAILAGADDFLVVDTNSVYELQKLYKLRRDALILDPFPHHGKYYRDFNDHVVANDCQCHLVGLEACREMLQALKDP